MFLDFATKSIELVVDSAATTNPLQIIADFTDDTGLNASKGSSVDLVSTGTAAVTIVSAPASSGQSNTRKINLINIYNADTAAKKVTVRLNNNGSIRQIVVSTLQVGDTLGYTDVRGWYVIDNTGSVKQTPASGNFTSINDSGNLNFTGTGNRITGDFSNATIANRVMFQDKTTNNLTILSVLPNGTSTNSEIDLWNTSDVTNASSLTLLSTGSEHSFRGGVAGTGTYLPMSFYTGGAERMKIDATGAVGLTVGQMRFPATQNPSADVHTLDDYVEGTFTPTLVSSGGGIPTYTSQIGTYTKIGNRVFYQLTCILATTGTLAGGSVYLFGLPFNSNASAGYVAGGTFTNALAASAVTWINYLISPNSSNIQMYKYAAGVNTLITVADLTNTSQFMVSGSYSV